MNEKSSQEIRAVVAVRGAIVPTEAEEVIIILLCAHHAREEGVGPIPASPPCDGTGKDTLNPGALRLAVDVIPEYKSILHNPRRGGVGS